VLSEFRCPCRIGFLPIRMLATVELDGQLACWAREVGDAVPDRMLPTEFPARAPLAQSAPKKALDTCGVTAKRACDDRSRP